MALQLTVVSTDGHHGATMPLRGAAHAITGTLRRAREFDQRAHVPYALVRAGRIENKGQTAVARVGARFDRGARRARRMLRERRARAKLAQLPGPVQAEKTASGALQAYQRVGLLRSTAITRIPRLKACA